MNSDQTKYGSLIKILTTQQSLKHNQYPKTLTEASEVLTEHPWDSKYQEVKKKKRKQAKQKKDDVTVSTVSSTTNDELELSFAQLENACYCCRKKGHSSDKCYKHDKIPKDQWYINRLQQQEIGKLQQHVQVNENDENASITVSSIMAMDTRTNRAWSGAHIQLSQNNFGELKNQILLDNRSSTSIFGNPKLVEGIKTVDTPLQLMTNGREIVTDVKANVNRFGEVWYDLESIANIFSFAELKDKHHITYDSKVEDAFNIHLPHKVVKFKRSSNGLYLFQPPKQAYHEMNLLNSVAENQQHYTGRQLAKAKLARKLYHNIGTPSVRDFKAIIQMNAITNCPVTVEDINIAEKVYGLDIGSLKGKTIQTKLLPQTKDYVEIPKELIETQQNVELAIDTMKVNKIPFLTTISKNIMYRMAHPMLMQMAEAYRSALDEVFHMYNHAGFHITSIQADQEFKPLLNPIKDDLGIQMKYANAQEHVPEAECNI